MKERIAYFAGIVDGEGCVTIVKYKYPTHVQHNLSLHIANNNLNLINWVIGNFGGNLIIVKQPNYSKNSYVVRWYRRDDILEILTWIYPYLIIKKKIVRIILKKWPRWGRAEPKLRHMIYKKVRKLIAVNKSKRFT